MELLSELICPSVLAVLFFQAALGLSIPSIRYKRVGSNDKPMLNLAKVAQSAGATLVPETMPQNPSFCNVTHWEEQLPQCYNLQISLTTNMAPWANRHWSLQQWFNVSQASWAHDLSTESAQSDPLTRNRDQDWSRQWLTENENVYVYASVISEIILQVW